MTPDILQMLQTMEVKTPTPPDPASPLKFCDGPAVRAALTLPTKLVDTAPIVLDETGIRMVGMDPSHVCLFDIRIGATLPYDPNHKGMSIHLEAIAKSPVFDGTVEYSYAERGTRRANPEITWQSKGRMHRNIIYPDSICMAPLPSETQVAFVEHRKIATLDMLKVVRDSMRQAESKYSAYVDMTDGTPQVRPEEERRYAPGDERKLQNVAVYSAEYLKDFCGTMHKQFPAIQCEYAMQKPMRIRAAAPNVQVDFWLAPRVEY